MKQRRSVSSLAAVFVVIFVELISSFLVAAETNHDCTGEDCPICYEISVCQETVRKLTFACAVFAAILLLSVCIVLPVAQGRPAVCHTLISLKVKLSDQKNKTRKSCV